VVDVIRVARPAELGVLQDIEVAAGRLFADIGMAEIADDEPFGVEVLATYQSDGRAWVTVDDADHPIAYLIVDVVDASAHVEQVSVRPAHSHRGVGRALLDHVAGWAVVHGLPALTLTTFADVPWNAPYYERCGFRRIGEGDLTPGLREIRLREAAQGLDKWPRVCIRRPTGPTA
jgi:GNAT superfamily N-acetyltransferase